MLQSKLDTNEKGLQDFVAARAASFCPKGTPGAVVRHVQGCLLLDYSFSLLLVAESEKEVKDKEVKNKVVKNKEVKHKVVKDKVVKAKHTATPVVSKSVAGSTTNPK